jgi:hypothetical protein
MCPDSWIPAMYFPEDGYNCNTLNVVVATLVGQQLHLRI